MTKGTLEKHTRDADTNNPPASKKYASSLFAPYIHIWKKIYKLLLSKNWIIILQ
jgi:hypothetical protein